MNRMYKAHGSAMNWYFITASKGTRVVMVEKTEIIDAEDDEGNPIKASVKVKKPLMRKGRVVTEPTEFIGVIRPTGPVSPHSPRRGAIHKSALPRYLRMLRAKHPDWCFHAVASYKRTGGFPEGTVFIDIEPLISGKRDRKSGYMEKRYILRILDRETEFCIGILKVLGTDHRPVINGYDMPASVRRKVIGYYRAEHPEHIVEVEVAEPGKLSFIRHCEANNKIIEWRVPKGVYRGNPSHWRVEVYDKDTGFLLIEALPLAYGNTIGSKKTAYRYARMVEAAYPSTTFKIVPVDKT